MIEVWKDIHGYEGHYQISNLGRVKSFKCRYGQRKTPLLRKATIANNGYEMVLLCKNGKEHGFSIHRLIAEHFIPKPQDKTKNVVNHKNCIKTDNRIENLEWISLVENTIHAIRNNLHNTHLNYSIIKKVREDKLISANQWAKILNVNRRTINRIKRNETWKSQLHEETEKNLSNI